MQQVWLALIGGLILGWLIEWLIDWQFWRRNIAELRQENRVLRRKLDEAQAQLAAVQSPPAALSSVPSAQSPKARNPGVTAPPPAPPTKGE
jgi:hypothetical protein